MKATRRWRSDCAEATEALAAVIAPRLAAGDIIGLKGELGSGKTCFVRGLARGLGVEEGEVISPSFVMVAEYSGRLPLYHIDLYRLASRQIDPGALREYLFGDGVSVIEWMERLPFGAVEDYLEVRLIPVSGEEREIVVTPFGDRSRALLGEVEAAVEGVMASRALKAAR